MLRPGPPSPLSARSLTFAHPLLNLALPPQTLSRLVQLHQEEYQAALQAQSEKAAPQPCPAVVQTACSSERCCTCSSPLRCAARPSLAALLVWAEFVGALPRPHPLVLPSLPRTAAPQFCLWANCPLCPSLFASSAAALPLDELLALVARKPRTPGRKPARRFERARKLKRSRELAQLLQARACFPAAITPACWSANSVASGAT